MCEQLRCIDEQTVQFGVDVTVATLKSLALNWRDGDQEQELEVTVLEGNAAGDVQVYRGRSATADPNKLALRLPILNGGATNRPVRVSVRDANGFMVYGNIAGGSRATVLFRLFARGA